MKKNKQFLYDYLNAYAPVAQETEGQKIWTDYITPFSDFMYTDAYGTSYGVRKRKLRKYETLDVNTHKVKGAGITQNLLLCIHIVSAIDIDIN